MLSSGHQSSINRAPISISISYQSGCPIVVGLWRKSGTYLSAWLVYDLYIYSPIGHQSGIYRVPDWCLIGARFDTVRPVLITQKKSFFAIISWSNGPIRAIFFLFEWGHRELHNKKKMIEIQSLDREIIFFRFRVNRVGSGRVTNNMPDPTRRLGALQQQQWRRMRNHSCN